jgi:hypothetical protein
MMYQAEEVFCDLWMFVCRPGTSDLTTLGQGGRHCAVPMRVRRGRVGGSGLGNARFIQSNELPKMASPLLTRQ